MGTHGASLGWTLLRWGHLVAAGVVAGGSLWWAAFVRQEPEAEDACGVAQFAHRQVERYLGATVALLVTAPHLAFFTGKGAGGFVVLHGVLVLAVAGLTAAAAVCPWHGADR